MKFLRSLKWYRAMMGGIWCFHNGTWHHSYTLFPIPTTASKIEDRN